MASYNYLEKDYVPQRVMQLTKNYIAIEGRVAALETAVGSVDLPALVSRVDGIDTEITGLNTGISSLSNALTDVGAKVTSLESTQSTLSGEINEINNVKFPSISARLPIVTKVTANADLLAISSEALLIPSTLTIDYYISDVYSGFMVTDNANSKVYDSLGAEVTLSATHYAICTRLHLSA